MKLPCHFPGRLLLVWALLWTCLPGCTTLSLTPKMFAWQRNKDAPTTQIMALWQPGEGRDTKGLPCRGFAGQIFFFQQGNKSPVAAEGDVQIYVFDDQGTEEERVRPIHVYEFKSGAWAAYLSETNVGKAYQVFIPYTRSGSHRAACSLRVKLTSPKGEVLLSDPADVILNGKTIKAAIDTQVSAPRDGRRSGLSGQDTHVATINRHGKSQVGRPTPETGPAAEPDTELTAVRYSKNTTTANYQKTPGEGVVNSWPEQHRHSEPEGEDNEIELIGWSLHAEPVREHKPSPTPSGQPARSVSGKSAPRPLARDRHPLADDSAADFDETAHPLFFEQPVTETSSKPQKQKSSLKIRSVSLD